MAESAGLKAMDSLFEITVGITSNDPVSDDFSITTQFFGNQIFVLKAKSRSGSWTFSSSSIT